MVWWEGRHGHRVLSTQRGIDGVIANLQTGWDWFVLVDLILISIWDVILIHTDSQLCFCVSWSHSLSVHKYLFFIHSLILPELSVICCFLAHVYLHLSYQALCLFICVYFSANCDSDVQPAAEKRADVSEQRSKLYQHRPPQTAVRGFPGRRHHRPTECPGRPHVLHRSWPSPCGDRFLWKGTVWWRLLWRWVGFTQI